MINFVRKTLNPAWYHGHGKTAPFFEGWYYKMVTADENQRLALIPGVFMNADKTKTHAFIQVLDGITGKAFYHRFGSFEAKENDFNITIDGTNHFTIDHIKLDIDDEIGKISGELHLEGLNPWAVKPHSVGYMGPYGWLPNLECYHGVLSFDHNVRGTVNIYGTDITFDGGRGYMEKDWGTNFPDGYIWQQSNHFTERGTSLTASIASFPALGRTIAGFGVGLWHGGKLYPFTTYNNTQVDTVKVDGNTVEWVLFNKDYELRMTSNRAEGGLLMGPEKTDMHKRVEETMDASIHVELYEIFGPRKTLLFDDIGRCAALEVVGNLDLILT